MMNDLATIIVLVIWIFLTYTLIKGVHKHIQKMHTPLCTIVYFNMNGCGFCQRFD